MSLEQGSVQADAPRDHRAEQPVVISNVEGKSKTAMAWTARERRAALESLRIRASRPNISLWR